VVTSLKRVNVSSVFGANSLRGGQLSLVVFSRKFPFLHKCPTFASFDEGQIVADSKALPVIRRDDDSTGNVSRCQKLGNKVGSNGVICVDNDLQDDQSNAT